MASDKLTDFRHVDQLSGSLGSLVGIGCRITLSDDICTTKYLELVKRPVNREVARYENLDSQFSKDTVPGGWSAWR